MLNRIVGIGGLCPNDTADTIFRRLDSLDYQLLTLKEDVEFLLGLDIEQLKLIVEQSVTSIDAEVTSEELNINYGKGDGSSATIPIPAATEELAGVVTPAMVIDINKIPECIVDGEVVTTSTTYIMRLINAAADKLVSLPFVTSSSPGVIPYEAYNIIFNNEERIEALENRIRLYLNEDNELTHGMTSNAVETSFRTLFPNAIKVDGCTYQNQDATYAYQWSVLAQKWSERATINIGLATSSAPGLVQGKDDIASNKGKLYVEVDGTMSVIGWSDLLTAVANNTSGLGNKVNVSDIVDNLTSIAANVPLSAKQGRALNLSKLSKIASTDTQKRVYGINKDGSQTLLKANLTALSTLRTVTLVSADWEDKLQTVSVTYATSTNVKIVSPALADYDIYTQSGIRVSAEGNGTLTFKCDTVPTEDVNVEVLL